jgi:ATP-binding cassette subfamily F protein 3
MATPEGAADMSLYARHTELKQKMDAAVNEWEAASMELDEAKGQ